MVIVPDRAMVWVLAVSLIVSANLSGQMAAKKIGGDGGNGAKPNVETRTLDLTQVQAIAGMPAATVVSYPRLCSSDGDIYSLVYATSASERVATIPDVYGVSPQRTVKHLTIPLPQNFKFTSVRSFFPGKFSEVYLIQGNEPQGIAAEADSTRRQ